MADPDFAFFQIEQHGENQTVTLMRLSDPHHRTNVFASVGYIDAAKLEAACVASETAKDGKIFRFPVPGAEALKLAGVDVGLNQHTYIVKY